MTSNSYIIRDSIMLYVHGCQLKLFLISILRNVAKITKLTGGVAGHRLVGSVQGNLILLSSIPGIVRPRICTSL